MAKQRRPRGRAQDTESEEQAMGTDEEQVEVEVPEEGAEFDATVEPDPMEIMAEMRREAEAAAVGEPPAPVPVPAALSPTIQAEMRRVAATEAAAEAKLKKQGGEVRVYYAMRGGKACNLSIQVKPGEPPRHDPHGNVIWGTGTTSVMIEFGKHGNPPGTYRTADAAEQAFIEASEPFQVGMIRRADIKDLEEVHRLIKQLEQKGVRLPKGVSASIEERLRVATGGAAGPQIQHGARSTRPVTPPTGVSQGFGGMEALTRDPLAQRALRQG